MFPPRYGVIPEKMVRQSEELPLHRVLDLAIFVCRALKHFREAYRYESCMTGSAGARPVACRATR